MRRNCARTLMLLMSLAMAACGGNQASQKPSVDSLVAAPTPAQSVSLSGRWSRNEWQNDATLEIDSVAGDRLYFRMTAVNGGHTGDVEGTAVRNGEAWEYHENDAYDECRISIQPEGDSVIAVVQLEGDCGAAIGVSYNGRYRRRQEARVSDHPSESLLSLGVFASDEADDRFRALTGTAYDEFVVTTHLSLEDEEDLDGFGAKVHTSGVRGLFTELEHIIMTDSANRIWAAVVAGDTVKYFTNTRTHREQLPKTIESWREHFREKPLIYASAQTSR